MSDRAPALRLTSFRAAALITALLIGCLAAPALAQVRRTTTTDALLTGHVVTSETAVGIAGVEILIDGTRPVAVTDARGDFRVLVNTRGSFTLALRKLGYSSVRVALVLNDGDSLHVSSAMVRVAQNLDTLRVLEKTAVTSPPRYAGFDRRRQLGRGTFFTVEQLERTGSVSIGDVLRQVTSIKVNDGGLGVLSLESARGDRLGRNGVRVPCRIRVMVNGFTMPLDMPLPVASPKELHGIEVYAGPATMPPELVPRGDDAFCGLVALWTK